MEAASGVGLVLLDCGLQADGWRLDYGGCLIWWIDVRLRVYGVKVQVRYVGKRVDYGGDVEHGETQAQKQTR